MCYIFVQMAFPVFHEFDADGTIRTNGLHWEGFPRLAWEALSAAGYLTPLTYEVFEFERYGVPRCRVIITVLPHSDHADWFDLSFIYWGFITHEAVESAALRVLTDFCDHNPSVVALSPFGPQCGSSLSVRVVSCCECSRPGMVGPYGSPTRAVVASGAAGCHSDTGSLS
jgi:hypothetical protein